MMDIKELIAAYDEPYEDGKLQPLNMGYHVAGLRAVAAAAWDEGMTAGFNYHADSEGSDVPAPTNPYAHF